VVSPRNWIVAVGGRRMLEIAMFTELAVLGMAAA
jgi:hypothetical protein